jgi:ABC-type amino acid transport substrate-binding protein
VDLLRRIAAEQGWDVQFVWVNTVNRGGLNRAFRTTIRTGACDVFLGLGTGGMEEPLKKSKLVLIEPTFAVRYVLVTFDPALADRKLARLARDGTVVGTTYFSPAEKLLDAEGLEHETFPEARRAIQALAEGRVAAALIPSTSLAEARRSYPDRTVYVVENFVPADAVSWNNTWAVRQKDETLKAFLEQQLAAMRRSRKMEALLQRYGIPYYAPVSAVTGALR